MKILFVCTANICRSPYMERYARHRCPGSRVQFASAGTHDYSGRPMDSEMAAQLTIRGIDPAGHVSRRLSAADLASADLVLTAERSHRSHLLLDEPAAVRRVFTLAQFAHAVATDEAGGHDLIARIGRRRPRPEPDHDIADPFRRGDVAAAACAERISTLLDLVVPRLAVADDGH